MKHENTVMTGAGDVPQHHILQGDFPIAYVRHASWATCPQVGLGSGEHPPNQTVGCSHTRRRHRRRQPDPHEESGGGSTMTGFALSLLLITNLTRCLFFGGIDTAMSYSDGPLRVTLSATRLLPEGRLLAVTVRPDADGTVLATSQSSPATRQSSSPSFSGTPPPYESAATARGANRRTTRGREEDRRRRGSSARASSPTR